MKDVGPRDKYAHGLTIIKDVRDYICIARVLASTVTFSGRSSATVAAHLDR